MTYKIVISPIAIEHLRNIQRDKREKIREVINSLKTEPDKKGKPLWRELKHFRSIHAAGRYRVVYQVNGDVVEVYVCAVGIRKGGDRADIYALAKKLFESNLLGK